MSELTTHTDPSLIARGAIGKEDVGQLSALLKDGLDPDLSFGNIRTPLLLHAAQNEKSQAVQTLLAAGASPDAADATEQTPLEAACFFGDIVTIALLLEYGANPNGIQKEAKRSLSIRPPLALAIDRARNNAQRHTVADLFLKAGASPDVPDALNSCVDHNDPDSLELLLRAGARPNCIHEGSTPLLIACSNPYSQFKLFDLLFEHGAEPDFTGGIKTTALHEAIVLGADDFVARLLDAGADPNRMRAFARTELHFALMHSSPTILEMLIEAGAHVDAPDSSGITPLGIVPHALRIWASSANSEENVARIIENARVLIRRGADPRKTADGGASALAALRAHLSAQEYLDILRGAEWTD